YTGDGQIVGLVDWRIPRDKDSLVDYKAYEKEKDAYITQLIEYEGGTDPNISQKQWAYAARLFNSCKTHIPAGQKWTAQRITDWVTEVRGLTGETRDFRSGVIGRVLSMKAKQDGALGTSGKKEKDHVMGVHWDIKFTHEVELPKDIPELLRPHLKAQAKRHNTAVTKPEQIAPYMVDAYVMWLQEISQSDVSEWARPKHVKAGGKGCSQALVSKWCTYIGHSITGYAMESFLANGTKVEKKGNRTTYKMDKDNGALSTKNGYAWGGLNKPLPDFESSDTIVSVKSRATQSIQVDHASVGQEEKKRHVESGKPIELRIYETRYLKVLRVYSVKALIQGKETV
ncbi:MAG: hypothetical protein ACYTFW_26055, partial [Planctomycetota bacterium]